MISEGDVVVEDVKLLAETDVLSDLFYLSFYRVIIDEGVS